jgi:hypothetical protein
MGMALLGAAMAFAGMAPSYLALAAAALLGGLGNSVFHPADYSIFNASISPGRLGRAYGVHSICGNFGWVLAPTVVVGLSAAVGWRAALVILGGLGIAAAAAVSTQGEVLDDRRESAGVRGVPSGGWTGSVKLLMATPILVAFAYFALLAMSQIGIQTFSVSALVNIYDAPLALATGALTAFLLGSAGGILVGAFLADRTSRHDVVAGSGVRIIKTPVRSPKANSHAERYVGTLRRECLDHLLIHGEQHLRRILAEYARHYNEHRPHQSREERPPLHEPGQPVDITARIRRKQVLHGLINEYQRAA